MFSMFVLLLSFSKSLAREAKVTGRKKCLFLNNELFIVRPTLTDMNPV